MGRTPLLASGLACSASRGSTGSFRRAVRPRSQRFRRVWHRRSHHASTKHRPNDQNAAWNNLRPQDHSLESTPMTRPNSHTAASMARTMGMPASAQAETLVQGNVANPGSPSSSSDPRTSSPTRTVYRAHVRVRYLSAAVPRESTPITSRRPEGCSQVINQRACAARANGRDVLNQSTNEPARAPRLAPLALSCRVARLES